MSKSLAYLRAATGLLAVVACVFTSIPAQANGWEATLIERLLVHDDGSSSTAGLVVVYMATNMQTPPACHTASANKFNVDLSRGPSKAQYAILLTAAATGQSVTVLLNNSCFDGVALLRNVELAG